MLEPACEETVSWYIIKDPIPITSRFNCILTSNLYNWIQKNRNCNPGFYAKKKLQKLHNKKRYIERRELLVQAGVFANKDGR